MKRREFLRLLSLGLAACSVGQVTWPRKADPAAALELRLAFLADAHLVDGDDRRPEARALTRAVGEIRGLEPAPSLVLFLGDLAHHGHPAALALGREILADLPAPCLLLMGEGDGLPDAAAPWRRLFGDPWFSHVFQKTENRKQKTVLQILGLHTAWCPGPGGPLFRVGAPGRHWLTRELNRLDPEIPLLVLSHAPLDPIFRPWQQWTLDGPEVLASLRSFRRVLCLHGHTHNAGVRGQGSGVSSVVSGQWSVVSKDEDSGEVLLTKDEKPKTKNDLWHLSLPATAWPGPQAIQGTPAYLRPGLGPSGCGWRLLSLSSGGLQFQPQAWQA